jgi:hypothetical protein
MKDYDKVWMRLTALARRAPVRETDAPPVGFSTRAVASGFGAQRRPDEFVVRYNLRAFGFAAALAVVCAVANFKVLSADTLAADFSEDPVGQFITQL